VQVKASTLAPGLSARRLVGLYSGLAGAAGELLNASGVEALAGVVALQAEGLGLRTTDPPPANQANELMNRPTPT